MGISSLNQSALSLAQLSGSRLMDAMKLMSSGELADGMVKLTLAKVEMKMAAAIAATEQETIGALLDIFA